MEATKTSTHTRLNRPRLDMAERTAMQAAALERARDGKMCANDLFIVAAYATRGIDAHPRIDVFRYNAWRALHRHVRKGEHGVRITNYTHREVITPDDTREEESFSVSAVVFHMSQTDPDERRKPDAGPARQHARRALRQARATVGHVGRVQDRCLTTEGA